jgi:Ca2+/Na+ antiporter
MGFTLYWILLIVAGAMMLVMAASGFGSKSTSDRIVSSLFGLGFLGYGLYLGFIFSGTSYFIFYYAFAVPVLLVVNAVKNAKERKQRETAAARAGNPVFSPSEPPTA